MAGKIAYCAIPTRFTRFPNWKEIRDKIIETILKRGDAPVIPFDVGPYEYFEGNPRIGRKRTLEFTIGLKNACDADDIFGISDGTMRELKNTLDLRDQYGIEREVTVHCGFDPEWEKYYEELKQKHGDLFARLRGSNYLIALVGPRAVGKTFWSDHLMKALRGKISRIKNTTTRLPRSDPKDWESYHFVSREEFEQKLREGKFLEHDCYQENYYGTCKSDIRSVLKRSSGIFAITPSGINALHERRFEINLVTLLLIPESEKVLTNNFDRRKIFNPAEREKFLMEVPEFTSLSVPHHKILITGNTEKDRAEIWKVVEPLINI